MKQYIIKSTEIDRPENLMCNSINEKPTENHKPNEPLTQKVITIYINLSEKIILCCNIVELKL